MSDNPYAAPKSQTHVTGVLSGSRADLKSVAKYQKIILVCVLIYFVAVIGQFALPVQIRPVLAIGVAAVALMSGAVCVFLLAMKTHGTVQGILLGMLCLVPLLGVFILFLVNQKATGILKQNGISVGFLGADLSQL